MTDQEINIAIAEACGWKRLATPGAWISPRGRFHYPPEQTIPDYLNDLNAMHEAEKGLHDAQYVQFGLHLNEAWLCDNPQPMRRIGIMRAASATARQRAEAFLRTLDKWKDLAATTGTTLAK